MRKNNKILTPSNLDTTKKEIITFIVGSKPEAGFPELTPDVVIGANGAIKRIQKYCDHAKTIGVVSNYVFDPSSDLSRKTNDEISGTKVDELIVVKALSEGVVKNSNHGISAKQCSYLSRRQRTLLSFKYVRTIQFFRDVFKNNSVAQIVKMFYSFLKNGEFKALKISTGIFGIPLVLSLFPDFRNKIYLIGIGIDSGSGHFYDEHALYPSNHNMPDKLFMRFLKKDKLNLDIETTDENFSNYLKNLDK